MISLDAPQKVTTAETRHRQICEHGVVAFEFEKRQCLLGTICGMTLVDIEEKRLQCLADVVVIIDN
jgi:hypothetical protein